MIRRPAIRQGDHLKPTFSRLSKIKDWLRMEATSRIDVGTFSASQPVEMPKERRDNQRMTERADKE